MDTRFKTPKKAPLCLISTNSEVFDVRRRNPLEPARSARDGDRARQIDRGMAQQNRVPRRTAQRWASEPDVRRQVEDWRRRILDRALGYMAGRSMWAVKGIAKLERPPSPSQFSSGRGGPSCTTRLLSPGSRISNTAWPSSRSKSVFVMETRLNRVKAGLGRPVDEITDRSPWDWYAQSCAWCDTPRAPHASPARERQRPPAGDWRVWAYVAGRARQDARRCVRGRAPRRGRREKVGCPISPCLTTSGT